MKCQQEFIESDWVQIGIVGKPYGVRGAFYVSGRHEPLYHDFEQVIVCSKPISSFLFKIQSHKIHKDRSILTLADWDRTKVESVVGTALWVHKSCIEVDEEDEYLWDEVVGKKVISIEGIEVGEIVDIANYGASDIVDIEKQNQILSLPFIEDFFDMSFKRNDQIIKLSVSQDVIAELWQPKK